MKKFLSLLCLSAAFHVLPMQAQTLFIDSTNFNNWYQSGNAGTLTKGTDLTWAGGGGTTIDNVIGRSFCETTLTEGETTKASFDLNFSTTPSIFSVGLFNTTGAITSNFYAQSPYPLGSFEGYYTFVRDNNASNSVTRDNAGTSNGTATPLVGGTNGGDLGTGGLINYESGTNYTVEFSLTLTSASQIDTLFRILDAGGSELYSIGGTDTSSPYSTFDGVYFRNYNSSGDVTFDSIAVSVIPEPTTAVLLLAGIAAGGMLRRRGKISAA